MIFVTVGTSPFDFSRLIKAMDLIAKEMSEKVVMQIGTTVYQPKYAESFNYIEIEEFDKLMRNARVIVSHAGEGNTIKALIYKKPIILVPRLSKYGEHNDDHQLDLAQKVSKKWDISVVEHIEKLKNALNKANSMGSIIRSNKQIIDTLKDFLSRLESKQ